MSNWIVAFIASLTIGCVPSAGLGFSSSGSTTSSSYGPPPSAEPVVVEGVYGPGEDRHWFAADDYLIHTAAFTGSQQRGLRVAKLIEVANRGATTDGHFLTANGKDLWTPHYSQTRIATAADLVVGARAFCPASWGNHADAPRTKRDARQTVWNLAAITDTADLHKGRVTVGTVSCAVDAVRVPR